MQDIRPLKSNRDRTPARPMARPMSRQHLAERSAARRVVNSLDGVYVKTTITKEVQTITSPVQKQIAHKHLDIDVVKSVRPIEHLSSAQKQANVERVLRLAKKELQKERRKVRDLKRSGLIFMAGIFILLTGYVSVDTLITNSRAKEEFSSSKEGSAPTEDTNVHTAAREGQDETELPAHSLSSYAVAADLPRALYIDKLKVASRILPMSVNKDGSVQAPLNIYDAGWYNGSVKPGEIGASFIDGHASGPTREGLFAYLDTLVVGDTLQVEKGDGTRLTYRVVHTEIVPLEGFDMRKALLPHGRTLKGLNIMTCTGKWVADKNTYDHRVVVYTELIS